jgi:hypothetical protein
VTIYNDPPTHKNPQATPSEKVCGYDCSSGNGDELPIQFTKTVAVKACDHCPSGEDVAKLASLSPFLQK